MPPPLPGSRALGFTLPELVMTIAIIGVLTALVAPRFMSSSAFESRGFYDEAQAVVRYAQKTAIAQRRSVTVCVEADKIFAISNAACGAPTYLTHPIGGANLIAASRGGVTLAPAGSFSFNGLGRPTLNPPLTWPFAITFTSPVAGDPVRNIVVAEETGYVSR
jgi:MSHA pilin protein MshC